MTTLVEGFDPDAIALARFLAAEGRAVRLASPDAGRADARELGELGIHVESRADLDREPGPAEIAYLDVWTPETAARVQRLRAQGTVVACLGDLLLERWQGPSIGITGTAGKTTTTFLVAEILRAEGLQVAVSRGARAGNLWPTADLLDYLHNDTAETVLVLELTSSHLAFMHRSPAVAAVISFWPDHLELHGSLEGYRAAKERIVRFQRPRDTVVVNADDASTTVTAISPAANTAEFSLVRPVAVGAYLDPERGIVLARARGETRLGPVHAGVAHPGNVLAAAAISAAQGASAHAIERGVRSAADLPWRVEPRGALAGIPVIDDGMAATPLKTAAALAPYPDRSVILVAGGMNDAGGGRVHATPEEQALLERACDEIARAARVVVVFGEARPRLEALLQVRRVEIVATGGLDEAVVAAHRQAGARPGAAAVVFSPMFPLPHEERARFAGLVRDTGI